jgi:enamine deaminase RidA (YjgF/YER057c/UK114 family)
MSAPKFEVVKNEKSPDFGSHFSLATKCNGKLYVSGMVGKDPATNQLVEGGVGSQTVSAEQQAILKSPFVKYCKGG